MKKLASLAALATLAAAPAFAEPTLYGKAHVALENHSDDSTLELNDRDSRVGIKGSQKLEGTSGLEAFYNFEYGTLIDDGEKDGNTFTQRNIFVGLKGSFGAIQAGKFDTPMKKAQKKIDIFGDTISDIKRNLTNSEKRVSNGVQYSTPKIAGAIKAKAAVYLSEAAEGEEGSDAISTSVAYDKEGLYLALAYDQDVIAEGTNVVRAVAQYNFDNLQLGALIEQESPDEGDSTNGVGVSAKYKINKVALKGQVVSSDIKSEGLQQVTLGADYNFSKSFTTYALVTVFESDDSDSENVVALGTVYKF